MSSTYSPDLRIELIGTGDQAGVWGATTNNNMAYVLEQAIAGYVSVSVGSANQALTYLNGATSVAADNQSVHASLALTTSTGANFAVYAPPASKQYTIYNASSYVATIYNSTVIGNTTAAGTGVAIPAGKVMTVWSDGTNMAQQNTHLISPTLASPTMTTPTLGTPASGTLTNTTGLPIDGGTTGTLPVSRGGTGATSITSGALIKGAGTSAFSAASASDIVGQIGSTAVTNATNATNSTYATNPASGGSFITSSNIGSQSVSYASNAGNASTVTNGVYTTNFTGSNQSLSANGYQKLPGGLIIQWGKYVKPTSVFSVSFPIAFPTAVVCVNITPQYDAANPGYPMNCQSPSTTGFTTNSGNFGVNYYEWFVAYGY